MGPPKLMGRIGMDALPYRMSSGDYRKMVIKDGSGSLGGSGPAWYYHGPQMTQEMVFPSSHRMPDDRYPYIRRVCSPIRSGGGGPYRTVQTPCESGVRIKILESGLRNLNPYAFALLLV